jgi:TolB-like protein/Tfp pilus assembly protein PilF
VSLIAELSRRNVLRVGAGYLALGWVVTQVTGTVAPALRLPEWTLPMVVWIGVIGFPFVLVFAWVYELTPDGLKRERDVDRSASITHLTARRLDVMIIGLLVLALILFAVDRFGPERRPAARSVPMAAPGAVAGTAGKPATATSPAVPDKSIAVLPFVNMSGDADNEYFSDGISEEILNVLARTPELQVAARTSSFAFKGRSQDIPQIARDLQVRMVLEGSVRRQDDRVRITAQLIDARTGFHVWSQTYDRKLSDIFAIQDEIARAIGDELKVRIDRGTTPGTPGRGTENLDAYDAYLRGLALWQERRDQPLRQAIELFEKAVALDPGFAQAHAGLALVYAVLPDYSLHMGYPEAYRHALDSAAMALALDPSLPEPYAVLASVGRLNRLHRSTAIALYKRAITLRPSFATAHQWLANDLMGGGDLTGAIAAAERASALDPRSRVVAQNHAVVLTGHGRYPEARAECDRVLEFAPDYSDCESQNGFVALLQRDFEAARRSLRKRVELTNPGGMPLVEAVIAALDGRGDRGAVARQLAGYSTTAFLDPRSGVIFGYYETPALLVLMGQPDVALTYLETHYKGETTPEWPVMMPALDPIRCHPRFKALVRNMGTVDPYAASVCGAQR